MRDIHRITWFLFAFTLLVSKGEIMATTLDPTGDVVDSANYTGVSLTVNDNAANGGSIAFTNPNTATLDIASGGVVKVGEAAAAGAKTGTGATTVNSGGVLEITDNTGDCIAGDLEVQGGGIIKVGDNKTIPADGAGGDQFAGNLTLHNGAKIQLGTGSVWSRNVTVS